MSMTKWDNIATNGLEFVTQENLNDAAFEIDKLNDRIEELHRHNMELTRAQSDMGKRLEKKEAKIKELERELRPPTGESVRYLRDNVKLEARISNLRGALETVANNYSNLTQLEEMGEARKALAADKA